MNLSDHKIKKALGLLPKVKKDDESPEMDTNTIIIEEYLLRFEPAKSFKEGGVIILTTADIINDLADMADLDQDEVNAVLIREGYRPGRNNSGSFGWLMRHRAE